jgi:hypothetical protein
VVLRRAEPRLPGHDNDEHNNDEHGRRPGDVPEHLQAVV